MGVINEFRANHDAVSQPPFPILLLDYDRGADRPTGDRAARVPGQPSAEDLDRADALRAAVASLPTGQRHAVALHYYAHYGHEVRPLERARRRQVRRAGHRRRE